LGIFVVLQIVGIVELLIIGRNNFVVEIYKNLQLVVDDSYCAYLQF
jgi:hypothetical protein